MKGWILGLGILLLPAMAKSAAPCNQSTTEARAACWKALGEQAVRNLPQKRDCGNPAAAGIGTATCFQNTVDSTCRYASGADAGICGTAHRPSCVAGSAEWVAGLCGSTAPTCPAGSPRAGLPPDPLVECGAAPPGGGNFSSIEKPFLLKPQEEVNEEVNFYLAPYRRASASIQVAWGIDGDPVSEINGVTSHLTAMGYAAAPSQAAAVMAQALEAFRTGGMDSAIGTGQLRLGLVKAPAGVALNSRILDNSMQIEAELQSGSRADEYGWFTVQGAVRNDFLPTLEGHQITATKADTAYVASAAGCGAEVPLPVHPLDTRYVKLAGIAPDAPPVCEPMTEMVCTAPDPVDANKCLTSESQVVGATFRTQWKLTYAVLGPDIAVTRVDGKLNGSTVASH